MRTVLQDAHPPCVLVARGHVIGNDVEEQAESALRGFLMKRGEIILRAQLRIERHRIDDVVAVRAPLARFQNWRQIEIANSQLGEIRDNTTRVGEGEAGVQLQAVRGAGNAVHFASDPANVIPTLTLSVAKRKRRDLGGCAVRGRATQDSWLR